jgi:Mg2+/citrate symporter
VPGQSAPQKCTNTALPNIPWGWEIEQALFDIKYKAVKVKNNIKPMQLAGLWGCIKFDSVHGMRHVNQTTETKQFGNYDNIINVAPGNDGLVPTGSRTRQSKVEGPLLDTHVLFPC